MRDPAGRGGGVAGVGVAKLTLSIALFRQCQVHLHPHEERKHQYRQDRGPLQQKADHDRNKTHVLRVTQPGIHTRRRQLVPTLSALQIIPRDGQQQEAAKNHH